MELSLPSSDQNDDFERSFECSKKFFLSLPKEKGWINDHIYLYQDYWYHLSHGIGVMAVQEHFKAMPTDIFLCSAPKSGTVWIKALLFATMNRTRYNISDHPLLTTNPHNCVPFLELNLFAKPPFVDVESMPSPRLFGTHIPFHSLPKSIQRSGSRVIYVCRNPKDVLVSMWYFISTLRDKDIPPLSLVQAFDLFCEGKSGYGPFWDHVKEYKKASLESPDKVLFITYEEMKRNSVEYTKRMAKFLGCPFSTEEENNGVVNDIVNLCSFESLKNLDVNKFGGSMRKGVSNDISFRSGKVGDFKNHLTTDMIEKLDKITKDKLDGIFPLHA